MSSAEKKRTGKKFLRVISGFIVCGLLIVSLLKDSLHPWFVRTIEITTGISIFIYGGYAVYFTSFRNPKELRSADELLVRSWSNRLFIVFLLLSFVFFLSQEFLGKTK